MGSHLANHEDISSCLLFGQQKYCQQCTLLLAAWPAAVLNEENAQVLSQSNRCLQKGVRMYVTYGCEFCVPSNPTCTHSTSHTNLPTCNNTLWINVRNLLFWEFKYPIRWNQSSPLNRMPISSALHPKNLAIHRLQYCFIIFVAEFVNHSCLMPMAMLQLYCISCWRCRQACLLCKLGQWFTSRCLQSNTDYL
jgi:hypothetical protein